MSQFIIEATDKNFTEAVLGNSHKGPVLVNYWAENAGPCMRLWPVLEKLANDYAGKFLLVNVDTKKQHALADRYGVSSVPTVKLFINGAVVEQIHGYDSATGFKKMLDKYLVRESDRELAQAVSDYQRGNIKKAFAVMEKLILIDPQNDRILLTHAKLLMREEAYVQAYQLLEKTPLQKESEEAVVLMTNAIFLATRQQAEPLEKINLYLKQNNNDCDRLFTLCSYKMMSSDFSEVMEVLLHIIKLDKYWNNQVSSLCMRGLFIMLGKEDKRVQIFRQRLLENL